jgi:hypothetical protein
VEKREIERFVLNDRWRKEEKERSRETKQVVRQTKSVKKLK